MFDDPKSHPCLRKESRIDVRKRARFEETGMDGFDLNLEDGPMDDEGPILLSVASTVNNIDTEPAITS